MRDPELPSFLALGRLRRFGQSQSQKPQPVERCELCGVGLAAEHEHLIDPKARALMCSCHPCALLFDNDTARYRRVPRAVRYLQDFRLSDAQWDGLSLPINLVFFFFSTATKKMTAVYPSPAGATESLVPLPSWQALVDENPSLADLAPDVEALLVNRTGGLRDYYRAPIDQCYKLVGLLRSKWRGFSGGSEAWESVDQFFATLKERSEPREGGRRA